MCTFLRRSTGVRSSCADAWSKDSGMKSWLRSSLDDAGAFRRTLSLSATCRRSVRRVACRNFGWSALSRVLSRLRNCHRRAQGRGSHSPGPHSSTSTTRGSGELVDSGDGVLAAGKVVVERRVVWMTGSMDPSGHHGEQGSFPLFPYSGSGAGLSKILGTATAAGLAHRVLRGRGGPGGRCRAECRHFDCRAVQQVARWSRI